MSLLQLLLNPCNQLIPLAVDPVLLLVELLAVSVADLFQGLDLLLGLQLVCQAVCQLGLTSHLAELPVQVLDLQFQALLEVLTPAVKFEHLVAGSEHALEEFELLSQELVYPSVCGIA